MLAENALTTLEKMKMMLGLSDISDERTDEIIMLLINKASSWIERQTGRHLGNDYGQTGNIGVIYRDDGWLRAGYRRGLAYDIVVSKRVIEVSYTAGYVLPKDADDEHPQTLPADLEGLVWEIVSQAYTNLQNGSQGLTAFAISDVHWTFDKSTHPEWTKLINLYRRY